MEPQNEVPFDPQAILTDQQTTAKKKKSKKKKNTEDQNQREIFEKLQQFVALEEKNYLREKYRKIMRNKSNSRKRGTNPTENVVSDEQRNEMFDKLMKMVQEDPEEFKNLLFQSGISSEFASQFTETLTNEVETNE